MLLTEHKQLLLDCMNDSANGNMFFDQTISENISPYKLFAPFIVKVISSFLKREALRKHGIANALAYKIYSHSKLFDGLSDMMDKRTLRLGDDHCKKHMMALRKCSSATAKYCFAEELKAEGFNESWSGDGHYNVKDTESMKQRLLEVMQLYYEDAVGGEKYAYNNFGIELWDHEFIELWDHKFNESWKGDKSYNSDSADDERLRLQEVAGLVKKSATSPWSI